MGFCRCDLGGEEQGSSLSGEVRTDGVPPVRGASPSVSSSPFLIPSHERVARLVGKMPIPSANPLTDIANLLAWERTEPSCQCGTSLAKGKPRAAGLP